MYNSSNKRKLECVNSRVIALWPYNTLRGYCHFNNSTIYTPRNFSSDALSDKQRFVLDKWVTDFPNYSHLTYTQVASLASKSNEISKWFNEVSKAYVLIVDAPDWYLDAVGTENDWNNEFRELLNKASNLTKELSLESNKISLESRRRLDEANNLYKDRMVELFKNNPELLLHYITTQTLPLETHVKAMTMGSTEESKKYLQTELNIKRKVLFKKFQEGKLSIDDLVDMLFVK